jgi:hypothetical protein
MRRLVQKRSLKPVTADATITNVLIISHRPYFNGPFHPHAYVTENIHFANCLTSEQWAAIKELSKRKMQTVMGDPARRRTSSPATRPGASPPTSPSCRSYNTSRTGRLVGRNGFPERGVKQRSRPDALRCGHPEESDAAPSSAFVLTLIPPDACSVWSKPGRKGRTRSPGAAGSRRTARSRWASRK